jgi:hypothetical protein
VLRNRVGLAPPLIHAGNNEVDDDKTVVGTALNISDLHSAIEPSLKPRYRYLELYM